MNRREPGQRCGVVRLGKLLHGLPALLREAPHEFTIGRSLA